MPTFALAHRVKTILTSNNIISFYKRKKIKQNVITHPGRSTRKSCYEEKKDDLVPPTKVVKIQEKLMEEGEVRDILEEMGFELPSPLPRCFFHPKKESEKKTSQAGFNYRQCPLKECSVFIGEEDVLLRKNLLKCGCRQPMKLCLSYSDMNPKHLYFRCQRNRCKVFQWTDEMPTGRNQELWNPNFVDFNDPL